MTRRVVVTGLGTVTALGESWEENRAGLLARKNAVAQMPEWDIFFWSQYQACCSH